MRTMPGSDDNLSGPAAQKPAGGLGVAAFEEGRAGTAAGGSRRGRGRAVLAVRGADHPRKPRAGSLSDARDAKLCRSAELLPRPRALQPRARSRTCEHLQRVKRAVDIPVIGSLNGVSPGGWVEYARQIEQAGADALELNIYYLPTDPSLSSAELEESYLDAGPRCPRARCTSRSRSSSARSSRRCRTWPGASSEAGADGLVLFNRFYQPDFDLENTGGRAQPDAQHARTTCACRCAGSPCCTGESRPISR